MHLLLALQKRSFFVPSQQSSSVATQRSGVPGQVTWPGQQRVFDTHEPSAHFFSSEQQTPLATQIPPPHERGVAFGQSQVPELQTSVPLQALSHFPQCSSLVCRFTQTSPQRVWPAGQHWVLLVTHLVELFGQACLPFGQTHVRGLQTR